MKSLWRIATAVTAAAGISLAAPFDSLRSLRALRLTAFAQDRPQDARQQPIRTQANYVRVDAYPTKDGHPVMDLRAEDFEMFEDGKPQAITAFEHVFISAGGPQAQRSDPTSVEASRQAAANPRGRILVIFLDTAHVSIHGTWSIREPLIRMLDRLVGPDDLVGVMTPDMAPSQVTLARRTEIVESSLRALWPWGTRDTVHEDPRDRDYALCYPTMLYGDLAAQMMVRRRERVTLEALNDLVHYLRDLREERKAVLAVSEGWLLYGPSPDLMRLRKTDTWEEPVPGRDPLGVGPGGKIVIGKPTDASGSLLKSACDTDRMRLSQQDNPRFLRDIVGSANRANTSFYAVDPRGLAATDSATPPADVIADAALLRMRLDSLTTIALGTDGLAMTNSNDLDASLKRMTDDLSSYYLLGYYASNTKLDGQFRRIEVRVKRPGVQVRARRGYRAPTEGEVAAAHAAVAPPPVSAEEAARASAMDALTRIRPEARFRVHATPAGDAADGASTTVWIAGELQAPPAADPWTKGGTADIDVTADGTTTTTKVTLAAGERTFLTTVILPKPIAGGALDIRARLAGVDPDAARLADSIRVPVTVNARQPLLFRRGATTGNRHLPAATFLFSRTERVRIDVPAAAGVRPGSGRMLDRAGQTLPVPVTVSQRTDDAGRQWITADVPLAPLGAGDYVIEITTLVAGSEHKTVTAIRVTR